MRVYRVTGNHFEHGHRALGWVRTEGQAKSAVKAINDKIFADVGEWEDVEYTPEDIPTDKAGFCEWLNTWSATFGFLDVVGKVMGVDYDVAAMLDKFAQEDEKDYEL